MRRQDQFELGFNPNAWNALSESEHDACWYYQRCAGFDDAREHLMDVDDAREASRVHGIRLP